MNKIYAQPYYRFFGAGFSDHDLRSDLYMAEASKTSEPIVDRNGNVKERLFTWANNVLAKLD